MMTDTSPAYHDKLSQLSRQFWASQPIYDQPIPNKAKNPIEINGVAMTQVAIDQLKLLGIPLDWYTADELEDAVIACNADARLIDDPNGDNYQDRLSLDPDETIHGRPPTLHGFHPDEFDDMQARIQPPNFPKTDTSQHDERMETILPDHVKREILAGMSLIQDPAEVDCKSPLDHGLHAAPYMCRDELRFGLAA